MAEPLLFFGIFGSLMAGAAVLGFWFDRERRIKRTLRKVPRTLIHDVKDGRVAKVVGRLTYLGAPLSAPLTGRACAYYRVLVEEYRSSGRSGRSIKVIDEEKRQDFVLADPTGRALVRVAEAQVAITRDANFKSGTFNEPTPALAAFLAERGISAVGWVFNKSLRYSEAVLEPTEDVAVGGLGRWEVDPDPREPSGAYREAPQRLVFQPSGEMPLFVSDDPSVMR